MKRKSEYIQCHHIIYHNIESCDAEKTLIFYILRYSIIITFGFIRIGMLQFGYLTIGWGAILLLLHKILPIVHITYNRIFNISNFWWRQKPHVQDE